MKLIIAILTLALMVTFACAQNIGSTGGIGGGGRGGGKGRNAAQNTEQQKKKAAENGYKAGLKAIPDAKEKFDPWRNAR
jgi:hypothetical protein